MSNCAQTGQQNFYVVTLTLCINTANNEMLNYYDIAKSVHSKLDKNHPMQKIYFNSIEDLKNLKAIMNRIDKKQEQSH